MTTRQFDPVFSAALRNELEALADGRQQVERGPAPARTLLARPQLWVSVVTALVLVVVTIGVLRVTHRPEPAVPPKSIDPMSQITDPADANYVAREVRLLGASRGTGTGTFTFDVPPTVRSVRVYVDCAPDAHFSTSIDDHGMSSGGCSATVSSAFDLPVEPGPHTLTTTVAARTRYSVLAIATPGPTIATGALIEPLEQVRDLRNPDALTGDTAPVLRTSGIEGPSTVSAPDHPRERLRAYFVCARSSSTARAVVDGHVMTGCMNSIAHWLDFTPGPGPLTASFAPTGESSFLVVRAPSGAKDTPTPSTLPYPKADGGAPLAAARGSGGPATGSYRQRTDTVLVTATCRGTGWLEIALGDGSGTSTRGNPCSAGTPFSVGVGGPQPSRKLLRWTVIPHGDIVWTFQLTPAR